MSTPERSQDWQPTQTSGRIVAVITLGVFALLLGAVPEMIRPTLLGIAGAGCLTLSFWLVRVRRNDTLTTFVAGALMLPAAVGLIGGGVIAALLVMGDIFPVPDARFVSVSTLVIAGNVGVFLGCVLAVLGVALGSRNVADDETLESFTTVGVLTGIVPLGATALYVLSAFLGSNSESGATVPDLHLSVVLSPGTANLHLADFLLLCAVVAGLLAVALRVLPVAELLADTGAGQSHDRRVTRAYYVLIGAGAVIAFLGLVLLPVELLAGPEELRSVLGDGLFELLRGVTTSGLLRSLVVLVGVLSALGLLGGLVASVVFQDEDWTASPGGGAPVTDRAGPLAAGVFVTLLGIIVADSVFETVVEGTANQLPEVLASDLRESAARSASVYGEAMFVVLFATILIAAMVTLAVGLRIGIGIGYLSGETTGYSLASAGLFIGVVFAATIDASAWLVFGGIVASLVVWDAGRFGTVLGREVGTDSETRSTELVHTGAAALVGLVGAVLAFVARSQFEGGIVSPSPVTTVALLAVVIGVLSFAAALR